MVDGTRNEKIGIRALDASHTTGNREEEFAASPRILTIFSITSQEGWGGYWRPGQPDQLGEMGREDDRERKEGEGQGPWAGEGEREMKGEKREKRESSGPPDRRPVARMTDEGRAKQGIFCYAVPGDAKRPEPGRRGGEGLGRAGHVGGDRVEQKNERANLVGKGKARPVRRPGAGCERG